MKIRGLFGDQIFDFWGRFWAPKLPKMSQDGLQRPSHIAKIAKKTILKNCVFCCFLYCFWNTNPPKRAPRQPRNLRTWFQGDTKSFSNIGLTFCLHLFLKMVPKKSPQSVQKNIQKLVQNKTPKIIKKGPILSPKMEPKNINTEEIWVQANLDGVI